MFFESEIQGILVAVKKYIYIYCVQLKSASLRVWRDRPHNRRRCSYAFFFSCLDLRFLVHIINCVRDTRTEEV